MPFPDVTALFSPFLFLLYSKHRNYRCRLVHPGRKRLHGRRRPTPFPYSSSLHPGQDRWCPQVQELAAQPGSGHGPRAPACFFWVGRASTYLGPVGRRGRSVEPTLVLLLGNSARDLASPRSQHLFSSASSSLRTPGSKPQFCTPSSCALHLSFLIYMI